MKLNVKKALDKRFKINIRYDITASAVNDIKRMSFNDYDLIVNGFIVGYWQGYKAAMKGK